MPTGCPLGKKDHEFGDCIYLGECEDLLYFNGIYKCKDCNLGEKDCNDCFGWKRK